MIRGNWGSGEPDITPLLLSSSVSEQAPHEEMHVRKDMSTRPGHRDYGIHGT